MKSKRVRFNPILLGTLLLGSFCIVSCSCSTGSFLSKKNKYSITFIDGNQVLESKKWEEGQIPHYDYKDTPDGCTFLGWSDSPNGDPITIPAVTGDATYYAVFEGFGSPSDGLKIHNNSGEIEFGFRSETRLIQFESAIDSSEIEIEENVKFNENDSTSFFVYWIKKTNLFYKYYLYASAIGCSSDTLRAITAGSYKSGCVEKIGQEDCGKDEWNGFKKLPTTKYGEHKYSGLLGNDKRDYIYLPLAFRVYATQTTFSKTVSVIGIKQFSTASSGLDLSGGIRCKVDYPSHETTRNNFIFNPNSEENEELPVGGPLNLNFDLYYDYDYETNKEIPYGEWVDDTVIYSEEPTLSSPSLYLGECTSFIANHKKDVYQIDLEKSTPCTCSTKRKWAGMSKSHSDGIILTDSYNGYGYVDLSIYLEGWSTGHTTDGCKFDIALEFDIV